jgi:thioredoxin 1
MKTPVKILIILGVAAAAAGTMVLKRPDVSGPVAVSSNTATADVPQTRRKIPRLLDLGATKCVPCKLMAPILDGLKKEYAGKLNVEFIDVWENEAAGKEYGVEMIPTQIFFDAEGKELFRHVGFFGKEDILAKWMDLGVNFEG